MTFKDIMTHSLAEQLIEAHLDFIVSEFSTQQNIATECLAFFQWIKDKPLKELCAFEQIYALLHGQILQCTPSPILIEQVVEQLRFALIHPCNDTTTIEDLIPVLTVDHIAQHFASKSELRQTLIESLSNHPAFSKVLTELIQHAIQDYLDNSIMSKKVPGVGRFMKMGKSVLESVTDASLDQTISNYVQKNVFKLNQLSETIVKQHLTDEKVYQFQAQLWHRVKSMPVSSIRNYIATDDLPQIAGFAQAIWENIRQSEYMQQQLHDGLYTWYARNQDRSLGALLRDMNIHEVLLQAECLDLITPLLQELAHSSYLRERARIYLEKFYYSSSVAQILASN